MTNPVSSKPAAPPSKPSNPSPAKSSPSFGGTASKGTSSPSGSLGSGASKGTGSATSKVTNNTGGSSSTTSVPKGDTFTSSAKTSKTTGTSGTSPGSGANSTTSGVAADGPNPTTGSGKAKAIPPQESLRKDLTSLARDLTVLRTGSTQEQLGVLRKMTENVSQRQFNEIVTNGANLVNAMSKVMTPQEAGAAIDRAVSLINTADQIYTRVSNVANALAPVAKMMGIGDGGPISLPPALEGLIPRNRGEMLQMGAKLARGAAPFVQQQFGAARADVTMSAANLMQSLANANLRPQGADGPLQLTLDKNVSDAAAFLMRTTQESRVLPDIQIPAAIRNSQDLKLIGTFVQRAAGGDGVLDGRDIRPVIRGGVNDLAQVRPLLAAFGANIIEEKAAPKVAEGFKKLGIPADPLGRGDGGSRNLGGPNMTFNALPQAVERFQRSIGSMGTPPGGLGGTDNGIRVTFPNGIPATAIPDIQAGRLPTGPVIVIERRR